MYVNLMNKLPAPKGRKRDQKNGDRWQHFFPLSLILLLALGLPLKAVAEPVASIPLDSATAAAPPEVDSSLTRTYEPATVYLPDPATWRLVPQVIPVAVEQPVAGAVGQIIQSYQGQEMGITGYEVTVDAPEHLARIDFDVTHEQGVDAFQSLSSANQVALFEAIRETLLTQPFYSIDEIIFSANGKLFEI